jgi:hypothetical protein
MSLEPVLPGNKAKDARWIDAYKADLEKAPMPKRIRQAATPPGWGKS